MWPTFISFLSLWFPDHCQEWLLILYLEVLSNSCQLLPTFPRVEHYTRYAFLWWYWEYFQMPFNHCISYLSIYFFISSPHFLMEMEFLLVNFCQYFMYIFWILIFTGWSLIKLILSYVVSLYILASISFEVQKSHNLM